MVALRQAAKRWRIRSIVWLQAHPMLTFVLMGLSFLGFGAASYNLAVILRANLELFWNYGWMVANDGGLRQLIEILMLSYFALACYLVFKCCEKLLIDKITKTKE
jgi:hypothetical protein